MIEDGREPTVLQGSPAISTGVHTKNYAVKRQNDDGKWEGGLTG